MVRVKQGNFSAGILSSGMYARDDTDKYQQGLRDAVNVICRQQGGVSNRSGLEIVGGNNLVDAQGNRPVNVPFQFSAEQGLMIEMAEATFRVIKDGAYVLRGAAEAQLTGISTGAQARATVVNPGLNGFSTAGRLAFISDPNGSSTLHETVVEVGDLDNGTDSMALYDRAGNPINTNTGNWGAVGAGATITPVYQRSHPYAMADLPELDYEQDGDVVFLAHPSYPPGKLTRIADDDWTHTLVSFGNSVPPPNQPVTLARYGPDVDQNDLIDYDYVITEVDVETGEESLPSPTNDIDNDLRFAGSQNTLAWSSNVSPTPSEQRFNIYKAIANGGFGYIGTSNNLNFTDDNITADTSRTPPADRTPFDSVGNYPSLVAFYEQRLVYGATDNDPQLVEMSQVNRVGNFGGSTPPQPDDAARFRLRAARVNRLRDFIPHSTFGIMTSGSEWSLAAQLEGEYVRPERRSLAPRTYYGSATTRALLIGETGLHVEPSGNVIRDFHLVSQAQPPGDLTVLARDLFEGRAITAWAYARAPHGLLWVVLDDGALLSMTYLPEYDIWGWTRHEVGGVETKVLDVDVIQEGAVDTPYFVVQRTYDGDVVVATERLSVRADDDVTGLFLDAGYRFTFNAPVSVVTGLIAIAGETVTAVLDGSVYESLTVDNTGTLELPRDATNVNLGQPYTSWIRTLEIDLSNQRDGSGEGRYKALSEIAVRVKQTRGVEAGRDLDNLRELREGAALGETPALLTKTLLYDVEGDWEREATLVVAQRQPLPMTVTAVAPGWTAGE